MIAKIIQNHQPHPSLFAFCEGTGLEEVPLVFEADDAEAFGGTDRLDETDVVEPLLFNIACNLAALLPPEAPTDLLECCGFAAVLGAEGIFIAFAHPLPVNETNFAALVCDVAKSPFLPGKGALTF